MFVHLQRLAVSLILLLAAVSPSVCFAQQGKQETVHIIHSDEIEANQYLLPGITVLRGNVRLRHKGMYMDCDSAYVSEVTNSFDAFDNVKMQQGDTLFIYGDYLKYDGYTSLAKLRYNCKLINNNTTLLTDSLNYDRIKDLAYYFDGGTMMDDINVLTSEQGEYTPSTKESEFRYDVRLVNPKYTLSTDTLQYNTTSGLARIVGKSKIDSDDKHIIAERGWYDSRSDLAELTHRPLLYHDSGKRLIGDTVFYNRNEGYSIARSNAILTDSINKNQITGDYCYYNELSDSSLVTGRARALDYSQGDTIYIHADTFKVRSIYPQTDSVIRQAFAYNHVRIYKSDMQAVCDSLTFSTIDTCVRMYKDPILWAQEQQQLGERIYIYLNDSTINHVHIEGQALSVERKDSVHYNQITGNNMWYYFTDGKLTHSEVIGNVLIRYYPEDSDKEMIGLNESTTTKFYLWMEDNKIRRMKMDGQSSGKLHPILLIPSDVLYLANFGWFDYIRPLSPDDIFEWRGKKSGSELQYKERNTMPLPNRGLIQ